jgi:hypothetical protein
MVSKTVYATIILAVILIGLSVSFLFTLQKPYHLPKIVWTHWDTDELPPLCRLNLERTRRVLHDWDVRFFTDKGFADMCPSGDLPPNFDTLSKAHKADFMRLWLLKGHGGVWMDSSIILNTSLNEMHRACVAEQAECSGFYIEGTTTDMRWPVFENWFIMAPQDSRVIRAWYDEFYKAVANGFAAYKTAAKRDRVHFHKLLQDEGDLYLTQHLCFQKVIQQKIRDPKILYKRAEDSMFKIHADCNWDGDCMASALRLTDLTTIPYIKLRGCDRALFPLTYFAQH